MSARRRLVVLALLALPLVSVPFGLAAGKPQETLDGTLRTWHGDTFSTPVGVGAGVDTTVAGLVALEAPGQAVQASLGARFAPTESAGTASSPRRGRAGDDGRNRRGGHRDEVRRRAPLQLLEQLRAAVDSGRGAGRRLRQRELGGRVPPRRVVWAARR